MTGHELFPNGTEQRIMEAERKLVDILPLLDKAERCGVDCMMIRERLNQQATGLSSWRKEFFNNTSPLPKAKG